ncbi:hypothetical protein [Glaciibacter psychrotolerans]|uniref:Uncharacterized protein n=1 Tax=Glaciibacter psychrotolerans TaxID=670054 RepID=A0A7Z0J796_9MICO|nr:hypothetical protein [Leifsonia psychrotolerans]NYJ21051.1 hypothetical protein [Leifsonia psychrotolerans]
MNTFESSPQELRGASARAGSIASALKSHPIHQLAAGDFGHAGLAAAVTAFQQAWSGEIRLREASAENTRRFLESAAADSEKADAILAKEIGRLGGAK